MQSSFIEKSIPIPSTQSVIAVRYAILTNRPLLIILIIRLSEKGSAITMQELDEQTAQLELKLISQSI